MAVILLAIAVAVFAVVATEGANNPARDSLGYVCVAAVVVPLLWLVSAAIMQASAIRATEIREDSVVLTGVAKSFRERAMEMRDRRYSEVVSETNGGQTMASEFQWTQPAADTKLCPYCAETINATAIKCRFCGEFLEDE